MEQKLKAIRTFCKENTNQANIDKYSRYFKEGFDGYGVGQKVFEAQRDSWIAEWKDELNIEKYLDLGDQLVSGGKYEEVSFAFAFLKSERENYTKNTFARIGHWFELGINDWASTDVLCMLVLPNFFIDKVLELEELAPWTKAKSEWQRRCVPVCLNQMVKQGLNLKTVFMLIEPLMLDKSQYVQKGIGTFLRSLWKTHPSEIEDFLYMWKDECGRLIVQYTTEKMDKEYRKKFRKVK
jgi:3-methyladenine DNA glycosylase AlkD